MDHETLVEYCKALRQYIEFQGAQIKALSDRLEETRANCEKLRQAQIHTLNIFSEMGNGLKK